MEERTHRKIRSFVRRPGRTTSAQRKALDELLPRFGIEYEDRRLDLIALFGREAPVVLDIGFGNGEALLTSAVNNPDRDYLGIEIHEPGIGHLLILLERAGVTNVRLIKADAVDVIANMLDDASLDGINIFFPDPWPKKRHHKRRLVQPALAGQCARTLKLNGRLHIATDWESYAEHIREVLTATETFNVVPPDRLETETAALRPPTKFERRGRLLGHDVWDFVYERTDTDWDATQSCD